MSSLKYWYICRLREKTSYSVTHTYVQTEAVFDGLVWLGTHHARARYAVRLVRFQVGSLMLEYLTNVLEPQALPVQEIARLYGRRWDIELAFLLLKEALGLHLWWNSKVSGILQQVWAALIIAQLLQAVRLEIACQAHVDPFEVSMPLVVSSLPQVLAREEDPISFCVQRGRQLGFIRPSSRTKVQAPPVAREALVKRPATLELQREPRYPAAPGVAGRKAYNAKKKKKRPPAMPVRLTAEQYACLAQ